MNAERLHIAVDDDHHRLLAGRVSDCDNEGRRAVAVWKTAKARLRQDDRGGDQVWLTVYDLTNPYKNGGLREITMFGSLRNIKDWYGLR